MPTKKLTDAYVKTLKCPAGRNLHEIRDEVIKGLEVRVTASGSKSWRLHYTRRSDGKRRAMALGKYPTLSLKDARAKAKRLQVDIEDDSNSGDPATEKSVLRSAETFLEIADDWIERHGRTNKSVRALQDDISMLKRHILPRIGHLKGYNISKRDIIRMLDEVTATPDARSGLRRGRNMTHRPNRVFELTRSIFRWAHGRDLVQTDPTLGISPPIKKEKPRERELSPDEIRHLWHALARTPITRGDAPANALSMRRPIAIALKFALATGQRIGEVACIDRSELLLHGDSPIWIVPSVRTKNNEPNRVPLSQFALGLIEEAVELAGDRTSLFPSPKGDGPIDPHAPTRALHRSREAIGLEDFRVHDLRRTAATRMAEYGVSPHTISLILNHVSARRGTVTGKVYVQYSYDREKREALDLWGEKLQEITGGQAGNRATLG